MIDTDMIVLLDNGGKVIGRDVHSFSNEKPHADILVGGYNDIALEYGSSIDGLLTGTILRPLNTNDELDARLYEGIETEFSFAYDDRAGFMYHGDSYGYGKIKFSKTQKESYFDRWDKYFEEEYEHHGLAMSIAWLGLANLAIIPARYFKWFKFWFLIHMIVNGLAILMTTVTVFLIYKHNERMYYTYTSDQLYHSRVGLLMGGLVLGQVFLGIVSRQYIKHCKNLYPIMLCRRAHHILGWGLMGLAFFNVYQGWKLYNGEEKFWVTAVIVSIAGLYALLELNHRFGFVLRITQPKYLLGNIDRDSEESRLLVGKLKTHLEIYKHLQNKWEPWVFFDEYVLDLSGFLESHPGGKHMLMSIIGQDAGKYVHGSMSYSGRFAPFSHPEEVFSVVQNLIIGYVGFDQRLLKSPKGLLYDKMRWEITEKFLINKNTTCLVLKNRDFVVSRPYGIDWMAKSFVVTKTERLQKVRRYYSIVVANLENWAREAKNKGYKLEREPKVTEDSLHNVRLYVKKYDKGKVSSYITELEVGSEVELKGPVGPGLLIDLPWGVYSAFVGGTGLNTMLDLIYLIWEGGIKNFKLYIYVSFSKYEDSYALDLLKATASEYPDNFCVKINISEDQKESDGVLSPMKLKEWFPLDMVSRAWVCGPPGFNRWICTLLEPHLPGEKIIMV